VRADLYFIQNIIKQTKNKNEIIIQFYLKKILNLLSLLVRTYFIYFFLMQINKNHIIFRKETKKFSVFIKLTIWLHLNLLQCELNQ